MSSPAKFFSLSVGLITGSVFGIYLSQNYEVPNMDQLWQHVISKVSEYTKPEKGKNDS